MTPAVAGTRGHGREICLRAAGRSASRPAAPAGRRRTGEPKWSSAARGSAAAGGRRKKRGVVAVLRKMRLEEGHNTEEAAEDNAAAEGRMALACSR